MFVTHVGMNGTSEAIKYAVPMICIPIECDQRMNAQHLGKLGLGIELNPLTLKPSDLGDAIETIFRDEKYRRSMAEFSKLAASYNGPVEGTKLIIDYLNEKEDPN